TNIKVLFNTLKRLRSRSTWDKIELITDHHFYTPVFRSLLSFLFALIRKAPSWTKSQSSLISANPYFCKSSMKKLLKLLYWVIWILSVTILVLDVVIIMHI